MTAQTVDTTPTRQESLVKQYWRVVLLFNPLVVGVVTLAMSPSDRFWLSFRVAMTIALVATSLSFGVVAAVQGFERRAARRRGGPARGRGWYMLWALATLPIGLLLASEVTLRLFGFRAPAGLTDYRYGIFVGTSIAGGFFLWYSRRDAEHAARLAQLGLERAQALTLRAQLSALTAQLNPHLLFNALNTIAALIPSEPERAEQTVLRLAELYRGVLGATRRDEHTLGEELRICRAYLDVERARFGERLLVSFELGPGLNAEQVQVPVLVLQLLVENAVTHGLADRARGGTVSISATVQLGELVLGVEDDGVGLGHSSHRGAGLGLETTRRRLELCHGGAARLELESPATGGTRVLIHLPLRALGASTS
jgi:signal transduction histidine kinase